MTKHYTSNIGLEVDNLISTIVSAIELNSNKHNGKFVVLLRPSTVERIKYVMTQRCICAVSCEHPEWELTIAGARVRKCENINPRHAFELCLAIN